MSSASSTGTVTRQTISVPGQLLLAGLLALLFAALALTLYVVAYKPNAKPSVANNADQVAAIQTQDTRNEPRLGQNSARVSGTLSVRAGEDTLSAEWLIQRNVASADRAATQPQADTLSAEWLVQRNAVRADVVGDLQHAAGENPVLLLQSSTPVTPYWSDSGLLIP